MTYTLKYNYACPQFLDEKKKIVNPDWGKPLGIEKKQDNGFTMFIPINESNCDFQDFLVWNDQQETPLDYTSPKA